MTQDEALALWDYQDGNFYWRQNRSKRVRAGDQAGYRHSSSSNSGTQYIFVGYRGKKYQAHRIIFLMHRGYLPEQIDHIDGNGLNNDVENLRAATQGQNQHNKGSQKNNTSGFKGVSWDKRAKKWRAQIDLDGKSHYLGMYDTPEAAHEAYKAAATKLHKEFANFG